MRRIKTEACDNRVAASLTLGATHILTLQHYLDSHLTLVTNCLGWPIVLPTETSLSLLRTFILSFTAFQQTYQCLTLVVVLS